MGACCETERKPFSPESPNPRGAERQPTAATPVSARKSPGNRQRAESAPAPQPQAAKVLGPKTPKTPNLPQQTIQPQAKEFPAESPPNSFAEYPVTKLSDLSAEYRLVDEYERDGDTVTYSAESVRTGNLCVVKATRKEAKGRQRLIAEATVLARLDHAAIAKVIDLLEDKDRVYLVKSHYTNVRLADYFKDEKVGDEHTAARVMQQLCSCVNYCHGEGIVIRSISAQTVHLAVAPGPGALAVVVADFENAGPTGEQRDMREKLRNSEHLPAEAQSLYCLEKIDTWSLGTTLCFLLTQERVSVLPHRNSAADFSSEKWTNVTQQAKSLLISLLQLNMDKRCAAIDALNHPWILRYAERPQNSSLQKAVTSLISTKAKTEIKQLVVKFMIRKVVKNEQLVVLTDSFQEFDTDYDGYITREELFTALQTTMRDDKARHETANVLKSADSNTDGKIDYTEFLMSSVGEQSLLSRQNLKTAFRGLDRNDDGRISAEELRAELGMLQHKSSLWEVMIEGVDLSGDGKIDFEEFANMMKLSVEG